MSFTPVLSEADLDITRETPLPHGPPDIIRGLLRERLATYITNHPDRLKKQAKLKSMLPNKANGDRADDPSQVQSKAEWVESQLAKLEKVVQGLETSAKYPKIMRGCGHCHVVDAKPGAKGVNWEIVPPNIPERWLPHSRFRHGRHEMLECSDCHYVRPPADPQNHDPRSDAGSIYQSTSAGDILMPSIANCRSCHGLPVGTPISGRIKARDDCIECHRYHHTSAVPPETRERWDREDGISDVSSRLWRTREVPPSREQLLENRPTE